MENAPPQTAFVSAGIRDDREYYVKEATFAAMTTIRAASQDDLLRKITRWFDFYERADNVVVVLPDGKQVELDLRDDGRGIGNRAQNEQPPYDWSQHLRDLCPFKSHERRLAVLAKLLGSPTVTLDETWAVLGPLFHSLSDEDKALILHWGCVWDAEK